MKQHRYGVLLKTLVVIAIALFPYIKGISPTKRFGRSEEIGSAALWLCCVGSSYVVIGHALAVNDGITV